MCSIGEDDFGDEGGAHAMVPSQKEQLMDTEHQLGQCKKCNAENVAVYKLFFRDFECRDCFLANARHKFRATLGSSKILRRDAKVLLIFDGTAQSIVLLDMLNHAQTQNNFKRLHCSSTVLFVDDTILDDTEGQSKLLIPTVHKHLTSYTGLKSFIAPITSTSECPCTAFESYLHKDRKKQTEIEFMERIASIRSLTSRQDFIKYQRKVLIKNAAKQLECNYIFQPEISTTLATQLLTSIVLGRGGHAAYDVALLDNRLDENIKVIRPLRDLSQPEIELYMRVQHFLPLKSDAYGISRGVNASLQNLTSAFVENLQQNYSSTVSTVFRSCDKIAPKRDINQHMSSLSIKEPDNQQVCSFCFSPIERDNCNTLLAIEFSRLVSQKGSAVNGTIDLDCVARANLSHINDKRLLCHACRNIENDTNFDLFGT